MHAQGDLSNVECYICEQLEIAKRTALSPTPTATRRSEKKYHPRQQKKCGGGGTRWCSVRLTKSHADQECKLEKKQANNGNANVVVGVQNDQSTASGERGLLGGVSFLL